MPKSSKRFVIISNQVNNYGYRVDTTGMDIKQYAKNPVMLYMHDRGQVVGHMQDVRLEANGDITGTPYFTDANPKGVELYKLVEEGTIRMCSAGFAALATSAEAELVMPGQRYETVTQSKLMEVSMVDVGADDHACALIHQGSVLQLDASNDTSAIIPIIKIQNTLKMKEQLIPMLVLVGLAHDATIEQLMAKVGELKTTSENAVQKLAAANDQIVTLNDTIGTLQQAAKDSEVDAVLDAAVQARKITAEQKPFYKQMGNTDIDSLKKLMDTIPGASTLQNHVAGGGTDADPLLALSYDEAHKGNKLADIKAKYPEYYKQIFKTKFGKEPQA